MNAIAGLVILVLDIIAIMNICKSTISAGKKILWVAIVIVLPVIGLVIYFLVGRKSA